MKWGLKNNLDILKMEQRYQQICIHTGIYTPGFGAQELLSQLTKLLTEPLEKRFNFKNTSPL
ncbi:hypothetical protein clem_00290 [Legionella clemsonensis]|uniref:Uncharacterized protein n=1 Tax=Legionella clemsonensis TaxID=1867846 RepID=A0A222NYJ4_9GAMM|nr:hypothetical protein clem_00290 [Legionella clemsonensis]